MATSGGISAPPPPALLKAIAKPDPPAGAIRSAVTTSTRASDGASERSADANAASDGAVSLGLDHDPCAVVQHEAVEPMPLREAVDERAETDALDDTLDAEPGALPGRHVRSVSQRRDGRKPERPPVSCGNPTELIGGGTDVGSRRWLRGSAQRRPLLQDVETTVIEPGALQALVDELTARGFRVLGPTVHEGAIVYDELASAHRAADRLEGRPGGGGRTASSAATTTRASATRSALTPGSSSCSPRA